MNHQQSLVLSPMPLGQSLIPSQMPLGQSLIPLRRFRLAMHDMIGYYPSYFFVICWTVITPAICGGVFFFKVCENIFISGVNLDLASSSHGRMLSTRATTIHGKLNMRISGL